MKKLISILLILAMAAAFAACGKEETKEETKKPEVSVESDIDTSEDENSDDAKEPETDENDKKPSDEKPAESKPTPKPTEKPAESKPTPKPTEKPAETPKTVGNKLLADFKSKAASMETEELANAIISNPIIPFSGVAAPVEEGFLAGFGNEEIKGFKSGATFAPMIGSIPFVGYVFELENESDVSSFISDLRSKAKLNWNICVDAEEMVTGSVGKKVFFVMCNKDFEE